MRKQINELQIKSLPTDVNIRSRNTRPYRANHLMQVPLGFVDDFPEVFTPRLSLRISSFIRSISLSLVQSMTSLESEAEVEDDKVSVGIGDLTVGIGTASSILSASSLHSTSSLVLDDGDWRCFEAPAELHEQKKTCTASTNFQVWSHNLNPTNMH